MKTIPRYYNFRLFLLPGIIYILLVSNIFLNITMNRIPQLLDNPRFQKAFDWEQPGPKAPLPLPQPEFNKKPLIPEDGESPLWRSIESQLEAVILMSLAGLLINAPLGLYFYRKRRGKEISHRLQQITEKLLLKTPWINGGLVLLTFSSLHLFQSLQQSLPEIQEMISGQGLFKQMMPVSFIASLLAALFTYLWQNYRVQMVYLEHVYPHNTLLSRRSEGKGASYFLRLTLTTLLTICLPLVTVILYIIYNITTIPDARLLTPAQMELIGGEIFAIARSLGEYSNLMDWFTQQQEITSLMYMSAPGTIRMIISLAIGLTVVLFYLFFIVRWNTHLLLIPLQELMERMEETAQGHFDTPALVRTKDEMGYLAERFNQMQQGLAEREKVKQLFGRYLTTEVSEAILGGEVSLEGQLVNATILFADIRDFTAISETLSPRETVAFLNSYLNDMIEIVMKHQGIIDKFIGDGLLAVFGAPLPREDHAELALQAALDMQRRLQNLNEERSREHTFPIKIGIGLHSGPVIAGNLGNSSKMEYTVIGDTVNVASRIEGLTKEHHSALLISEETWNLTSPQTRNTLAAQKKENITIRGKSGPLNLYDLTPCLEDKENQQ